MAIAIAAAPTGAGTLAWYGLQPAFGESVRQHETEQRGALRWHDGKPLTVRMTLRGAQGVVLLRESYRGGLRHGLSMQFDARGRLSEACHYTDGEKTGRHQGWWPDGKPCFDMQFVAGAVEGEALLWHANGRLAQRMQYVHGYEQGPQSGWHADGSVQFAYEMQGGRRFGMLGSTPCDPPESGATSIATKRVANYQDTTLTSGSFYAKLTACALWS